MFLSLCTGASHVLINFLVGDGSRVRFFVPCHDEEKKGEGQEAEGEVVAFVL